MPGRRDGRLREPARARLPRRSRSIARRAARRRSSNRSGRGSRSSSRRRVGVDGDPRAARRRFIERAIAAWSERARRSGSSATRRLPRLSIVSFTIRHDGRYLHHNFVVALLNDLFGIQSRGGCSCAGPYGHRLLGIDIETSHAFEREISRGCEGIKPGWVRVNFNYFISEAVFDYIVRRRRARRPRRLAAAAVVPVRAGDRAVAARGRLARAAAVAPRHPLRRRTACATRRTATASRSRGSPTTSPRRARSWRTRSPRSGPPPGGRARSTSARTSSRCAGSGSRTRSADARSPLVAPTAQ